MMDCSYLYSASKSNLSVLACSWNMGNSDIGRGSAAPFLRPCYDPRLLGAATLGRMGDTGVNDWVTAFYAVTHRPQPYRSPVRAASSEATSRRARPARNHTACARNSSRSRSHAGTVKAAVRSSWQPQCSVGCHPR